MCAWTLIALISSAGWISASRLAYHQRNLIKQMARKGNHR